MKSRTTPLTLLAVLLFSAGGTTALADVRAELGTETAALVEGVLVQIHPGSQVEWTPAVAIVQGSTRRAVRIGDVDVRHDDDGGYTGVVAFEMTDGRAAIVSAVRAFEPAPSRSPAEIVEFKANAARHVTAVRRGSLADPAAVIENVEDVQLTMLTYHLPWPDVYVTYTGLYGTGDFHGQVKWDEKLTFDGEVVATGRAPTMVSRTEKQNGAERNDTVKADVVDENTISFASGTSGHVISNCADPCLPDGRVLLALWWTSTVATP
jgi:hypothetical protein